MTTLEATLETVAQDPGFSSFGIADKMAYLQSEVLPKADPDFKTLSVQDQRTYIGQVILPAIKQVQTQRAFSGQFSKPQGPGIDPFAEALKPNSDYEFSSFAPAGMMIPVPRETNQATGRAILESLKGASLGYADLTNAIPDPFKTPESQGLYEAARMAGEFAPFSAIDSLIAKGALSGVGLGTKMLRGAASMGAVEAARKREGQDQIDPLGRIQSAGEGALYGAAIPVAEKALGSIIKMFGRTKGNPLRLISKAKIQGPRVRGLENAIMQEPAAYRTKGGLVSKEQRGVQKLGKMTQQRVNQAANATGLTKADALSNRKRAISKLYDDMTALAQHPQATPKQRAFAEKAAKAIKERYENAQKAKDRAAIQAKYRAMANAKRVQKAVSDLTTDKVPYEEKRAIREKFQQKAQEQNARERLLSKLKAKEEAEAIKAKAKTEAETTKQQRRLERQKELEAKRIRSAQEKIELENLKAKNKAALEEQKYRNKAALLKQKGQPAPKETPAPKQAAPKPVKTEAPLRDVSPEPEKQDWIGIHQNKKPSSSAIKIAEKNKKHLEMMDYLETELAEEPVSDFMLRVGVKVNEVKGDKALRSVFIPGYGTVSYNRHTDSMNEFIERLNSIRLSSKKRLPLPASAVGGLAKAAEDIKGDIRKGTLDEQIARREADEIRQLENINDQAHEALVELHKASTIEEYIAAFDKASALEQSGLKDDYWNLFEKISAEAADRIENAGIKSVGSGVGTPSAVKGFQREIIYPGKATHKAQPTPKEASLPGLNALQGHVEVQRRPDLIKALDESYRKNEFGKPKYNAEIVGQELDKLPGKGFMPYQITVTKNGTAMIRVIDHEGQFRSIKLFDGKGGSSLDSFKPTGEKSPFQLASDPEDLTKTGTGRQRVLNTETGAIEPIYKSGEAIKTSELQVHEDVLRNARDVLARAEAGKATPREIVQASKAVTDQDIERTLSKMTPEKRRELLKEITGKDCQ